MDLGSTHPLNRNEYQESTGGKVRLAHGADNLAAIY
jgi:hypothetical protein